MEVHRISLSSIGVTYVTADHHLWPGEIPDSLVTFCDHLNAGDSWWILGDFFEVWLENHWGMRKDYKTLLELLKSLTDRKVEINLLVGNRDFVAGLRLEKCTGIRVFEGAWVFESAMGRQMMIHGDELLPSDVSYQKFKSIIRNSLILNALKCLPMGLLLKLAGKTRERSQDKIGRIAYDKFKMDCQLIQKACEDNEIMKCWAGHLHIAQKQTFLLAERSLEVEILPQSTERELHALVFKANAKPEYRVWG